MKIQLGRNWRKTMNKSQSKGIDITRVQVLARHSNIATTNIYTHLNPKIALEEFRRKF